MRWDGMSQQRERGGVSMLRWGAALALAWASAAAWAQPAPSADPSACLVRPALHDALRRHVDRGSVGTFNVVLHFTQPDAPPRIEWQMDPVSAELSDELTFYFQGFRLPCLQASQAPVSVKQRVALVPDAASADAERRAPADGPACVKRMMGEFPGRHTTAEGKALLRLTFDRPGTPSRYRVLYRSPGFNDLPLLKEFADLHQFTCSAPAQSAELDTVLILQGGRRLQFTQPVKFKDFLPLVKDWRQQTFDFDLNAMGCPFDVRWALRQPHADNAVTELDAPHPARAPLLDWLKRQVLRTQSAEEYDQVVFEPMTLQMPCGRLKYAPPQ